MACYHKSGNFRSLMVLQGEMSGAKLDNSLPCQSLDTAGCGYDIIKQTKNILQYCEKFAPSFDLFV